MKYLKYSLFPIIVLFVFISGILDYEPIKKSVRPKAYWREKVNDAKDILSVDSFLLRQHKFDIEKLQRTRDIIVAERVSEANFFGLDIKEVKKHVIDSIRIEIINLREFREILRETLEEDLKSLRHAELELSKIE